VLIVDWPFLLSGWQLRLRACPIQSRIRRCVKRFRLPRGSEALIGPRCIGGEASGQQVDPENPGASGYNDNWLGTVSRSAGMHTE